MKRRVVVRPEARAELAEAAAWYRSKSPALAARFRKAVREAMIGISEWPAAFAEVSDGIRRALTNNFRMRSSSLKTLGESSFSPSSIRLKTPLHGRKASKHHFDYGGYSAPA